MHALAQPATAVGQKRLKEGPFLKFYTLQDYRYWHRHHDGRALEVLWGAYKQHLASLHGRVPESVVELANLRGVHDGLLLTVAHDRQSARLTLRLRCGDLRIGYYDLVLEYEDANLSPDHDRVLAWVARTRGVDDEPLCDLAWHELDVDSGGRILHRMLYNPGVWFEVSCGALSWRTEPMPDRRLERVEERYPGGPTLPRGYRPRGGGRHER